MAVTYIAPKPKTFLSAQVDVTVSGDSADGDRTITNTRARTTSTSSTTTANDVAARLLERDAASLYRIPSATGAHTTSETSAALVTGDRVRCR